MIIGIGSDIVALPRLKRLLSAHPQRLPKKLLGENEERRFWLSPRRCEFLAARIAAKEALAKALGLGMRAPLGWRRVAVEREENGKPFFVFADAMQKHLRERGIARCHLSITHDGDYAAATVVAESAR